MPKQRPPRILIPGSYQLPSGVVLLNSVAPSVELPPELVQEPDLVAQVSRMPSFLDQLHVFATEEFLGLPQTPRAAVIEWAHRLPFGRTMRALAQLQRALYIDRIDQQRQRELVRDWYGIDDDITRRCERFLAQHPNGVIFSEQQLFAMQRLVMLYARDDSDESGDGDPAEYAVLCRALLAVPNSILGTHDVLLLRQGDEPPDSENWLRYFVGTGGFGETRTHAFSFARAHRLYHVVHRSAAARRHPERWEFEDMLKQAFDMSFLELQGLGLVVELASRVLDESRPLSHVNAAQFRNSAVGARAESGFRALAADREWFVGRFAKTQANERRAAFEITPFLQRPGVRFSNDEVLIVAPRAIESWLGATGAYYRFLDLALDKETDKRERDKITQSVGAYNGFLTERYCRTVVHSAHPTRRAPAGVWLAGRVFGEREYKIKARLKARSWDFAIDMGQDLVVGEVTSSRLTEKALVEADLKIIERDLGRMILEKVEQVANRIRDFNAGLIDLDGANRDVVRRIWPVVVISEGLFMNPALHSYIEAETVELLALARTQKLTVLDVEELEYAMGLAEQGHSVADVLDEKTQPLWASRSFGAFLYEHRRRYGTGGNRFVSAEFDRAWNAVKRAIGLQEAEEDGGDEQLVA